MKTAGKTLTVYIIIIFILMGVSVFFSPALSANYLSIAIIAMGIIAIIFQKLHKGKFVDMGYRLNRNAIIGIFISLVFLALVLFVGFAVPVLLGQAEIVPNEQSELTKDIENEKVSLSIVIGSIIIIGGLTMSAACLFGEELAFRGYIPPKLEKISGPVWAIIFTSLIFGLWHLPAYFSIYKGGSAESMTDVPKMLGAHAVSSVPLAILYLTTRELHGVSLYHALVDLFQEQNKYQLHRDNRIC